MQFMSIYLPKTMNDSRKTISFDVHNNNNNIYVYVCRFIETMTTIQSYTIHQILLLQLTQIHTAAAVEVEIFLSL